MVTASVLAKVIHDKYELDVPLYRQVKEWQRIGFDISETTLCNWVIKSSEILVPLYDLLHGALVKQVFLRR
ncbi:hypothetical protein AAW28_02375 [Lacticaseibacillus casei]|nr:hypothetical protein AAW28_02375 [Lacticaseibacillus casei]